jgi:MFS family permease
VSRFIKNDTAWVVILCTILLLILFPYFGYTAMLPVIRDEWGMSSTEAGFIFGATQIGYVSAVLLLMPLTDRVKTSYVLLGSSSLCLLGNLLFPFSQEVISASIFRAISGAGLSGTYMPGLRLISERFVGTKRGRPVGYYIAAFTLGGAVSFGGASILLPPLGWRGAYMALSLFGIASVALAALLAIAERKQDKQLPAPRSTAAVKEILGNKPVLLMTTAYSTHVWELYGVRAWVAPFLAAILMANGRGLTEATSQAANISSIMVFVGAITPAWAGAMSDRHGRTLTGSMILATSGLCSLLLGWLFGAPFWLTLAVCFINSVWVTADSPIYSTAVTELASKGMLGSTMAFQSVVGFSGGIISPIVFGVILDAAPENIGWGLGFAMLGVVALIGVLAMQILRRMPESKLLAGGNR